MSYLLLSFLGLQKTLIPGSTNSVSQFLFTLFRTFCDILRNQESSEKFCAQKRSKASWEYRRYHTDHRCCSGESVQMKRFFPRPPSIILVFSGDSLKDCLHFLNKAAWKYRREHANYDSGGESGQLKNIYFWFWFASQCS